MGLLYAVRAGEDRLNGSIESEVQLRRTRVHWLREQLTAHKLTQVQAASKLQVHKNTLSRWLMGEAPLDPDWEEWVLYQLRHN